MLISGLHLTTSDSLYSRILRRAYGAFSILTRLVEATLVEGVFAEEVDGR